MMKNFLGILTMVFAALAFVGCSAADDDLTGQSSVQDAQASSFALISYTQTSGTPVVRNDANANNANNANSDTDEKLVCKVLKDGKLQLTHRNVVFDEATNIALQASLKDRQLTLTESGAYGESGNYGYYTLTATVGKLTDGIYTIVVKRNDNTRAVFSMTYDSTKAKE